MQVLSAPGHELLAGDAGARAGARGRPHATPQPHRSSAGHGDQPPRIRHPLAGRPDKIAPPQAPPIYTKTVGNALNTT